MKRTKKALRLLIVSLIGWPLFILGLILIPLPGPGVLISLIAFWILAREYSWAQKGLDAATKEIKMIYHKAKDRADKIENWGQTKR